MALQVTVVQPDTRDPSTQWVAAPRRWTGGPDHRTQQKRYVAANPAPGARPYWCVTPLINAWACGLVGWTYRAVQAPPPPGGRHPSWCKLRHVLDHWDDLEGVTVVLDTDAWVRDARALRDLLHTTMQGECVYVAAGEPPGKECADHGAEAVNGGFFAFAKDQRVRQFFEAVWAAGEGRYASEWPYEQACMGAQLAGGPPPWMTVLPVEACNTPAGTCVAHCWYKALATPLAVDDLLVAMAREYMPAMFSKPSVEFVVARHDEDVSWLGEWVSYADRITVYDKSPTPMTSPHPAVKVVPLPNVGREAHTYAHHFAEQYDSLCDIVVCTQARFQDHGGKQQFDAMVLEGKEPPATPLEMAWWSSPMRHFGWTPDRNHARQPMTPAGMSLGRFFLSHVVEDLVPEKEVTFWAGAIFRTARDAVRRHPRAKYEALRDLLAAGGSNPETAHMAERSWRVLLA